MVDWSPDVTEARVVRLGKGAAWCWAVKIPSGLTVRGMILSLTSVRLQVVALLDGSRILEQDTGEMPIIICRFWGCMGELGCSPG